MAKVIWLGEDELHSDDRGGPSFTTWNGVKFPKGVAVEVQNEKAIAKARGNQFFKVVEDVAGTAKAAAKDTVDLAADTVEGAAKIVGKTARRIVK